MANPTKNLSSDELACLPALAKRLTACGYTDTEAGVEKFKGEPVVFVRGRRNGQPLECSVALDQDPAAALRSLTRVVEAEERKKRYGSHPRESKARP